MGKEIENTHFRQRDFNAFAQRLAQETEQLQQWFAEGRFKNEGGVGGFELEIWLVDNKARPMPENHRYLYLSEAKGLPVVSELSKFNLELNGDPQPLNGRALSKLHTQLDDTWFQCRQVARSMAADLVMVGILPNLREEALSLGNMSEVLRYRALNEQVLRLRGGKPIHLDIDGRQHLRTYHTDVMLESAATSFQIHLQLEPKHATRYYNAAHILSAPMVAISANSPYLFGFDLWDETRIPLFEQAVSVGGMVDGGGVALGRVTFGSAYVTSLFECFQRNRELYPILLPAVEENSQKLPHVCLHNGTIWRWNRPLIGFDAAGEPHLRLEHRVAPAGPTVVDAIANAAFFYGMIEVMSHTEVPPEQQLDFDTARNNFYAAAKNGLESKLTWLNGGKVTMFELLQSELLPMARKGLERLAIAKEDIDLYLGIIEGRLRTKRNGASWQRDFVAKHGGDMEALTAAYLTRQNSGEPVHEWSL